MQLHDKHIQRALQDHENIYKELCQLFVIKYFTYDDGSQADRYIIGDTNDHLHPGPLCIDGDMFYNISEVYEALKNNLPKKHVHDRASDIYDGTQHQNISFYNYCKYNKGKDIKKPTKKQIKESDEKVEKARLDFMDEMKKYMNKNK